jgi:hypothetical protein
MTPTMYRLGQAAKLLGCSTYTLRQRCAAGLVEADLTEKGQWRIPPEECERLKREGLPPLPAAEPAPAPGPNPAPSTRVAVDDEEPESPEVQAEKDKLIIQRNRLERRRLELDQEDVEDGFVERQRRRRQEAEAETSRCRQAEEAAARKEWEDAHMNRALVSLPRDCAPALRLRAANAVREALAGFGPHNRDEVVSRIVADAIAAELQPYYLDKRRARAIEEAVSLIPRQTRGADSISEARVRELARAALMRIGPDADDGTLSLVAKAAARPVVEECTHAARIDELADSGRWLLWEANADEQKSAEKAIRKALAALPVGTPLEDMQRRKEAVLKPLERMVRGRMDREKLQRQAEQIATQATGYILSCVLDEEWEFDSYSEEIDTRNALAPELRDAVIEEVLEGNLNTEGLRDFVAEWVSDNLDGEEETDD